MILPSEKWPEDSYGIEQRQRHFLGKLSCIFWEENLYLKNIANVALTTFKTARKEIFTQIRVCHRSIYPTPFRLHPLHLQDIRRIVSEFSTEMHTEFIKDNIQIVKIYKLEQDSKWSYHTSSRNHMKLYRDFNVLWSINLTKVIAYFIAYVDKLTW
jgi:hypothetical protein